MSRAELARQERGDIIGRGGRGAVGIGQGALQGWRFTGRHGVHAVVVEASSYEEALDLAVLEWERQFLTPLQLLGAVCADRVSLPVVVVEDDDTQDVDTTTHAMTTTASDDRLRNAAEAARWRVGAEPAATEIDEEGEEEANVENVVPDVLVERHRSPRTHSCKVV